MPLDTSVPGFPEMDDWPTAPVLPAHIIGFGGYRDGGPQGGSFYVELRDSAGNVFPFFFDRFLGRLCYGSKLDSGDDAAFIRKGSKFESEAFAVIETAAARSPEYWQVAKRLARARRRTDGVEGVSRADDVSPAEYSAVSGRAEGQAAGPRLVFRDGVAYVEGCDVPVWRLEMGRRAGSSPDAQIGAFPSLTPQGLDLAYAYAQEHSAEFDALIQYHSGASVPPEDEGDEEDEAAFDADLEALLTEHAEVFRRLAQ